MRSFVALIAVVGIAVGFRAAGTEARAAAAGAPDPKLIVLTLGDAPRGFALGKAGHLSNTAATARDPAKRDFARLGRVGGYVADFHGPSGGRVESVASTYASVAWAQRAFLRNVATAERLKSHRLRLGVGLGDEARFYTSNAGPAKDGFLVIWRTRSIYAGVWETGPLGAFSRREVVELARKQQARILHALR